MVDKRIRGSCDKIKSTSGRRGENAAQEDSTARFKKKATQGEFEILFDSKSSVVTLSDSLKPNKSQQIKSKQEKKTLL